MNSGFAALIRVSVERKSESFLYKILQQQFYRLLLQNLF